MMMMMIMIILIIIIHNNNTYCLLLTTCYLLLTAYYYLPLTTYAAQPSHEERFKMQMKMSIKIIDKSIGSECRDGRERAAGSGPAVPRIHPGYLREMRAGGPAKFSFFAHENSVTVFDANGRRIHGLRQ